MSKTPIYPAYLHEFRPWRLVFVHCPSMMRRMLSDRSYMRDAYPREKPSALMWIVAVIVSGFVLQNLMARVFELPGAVESLFQLSRNALLAGRAWTLVTYSFLHDVDNLLYVVGTLLSLYFIGRVLQPMLGWKKFLGLYVATTILGGAVWMAVHWATGGALTGASAAVFGLFTVFACFYPNQPVTFLLFFIVPITLKPKHVAIALACFDLAGTLFYEVLGAVSPFNFFHSAHLGGMAAGWIYYRYFHEASWRRPSRRADIEPPRWAKKAAAAPAPVYQVNLGSPVDLRAEVDRILDKINSQGFAALTAEEKHVLDEAKDTLSRR